MDSRVSSKNWNEPILTKPQFQVKLVQNAETPKPQNPITLDYREKKE